MIQWINITETSRESTCGRFEIQKLLLVTQLNWQGFYFEDIADTFPKKVIGLYSLEEVLQWCEKIASSLEEEVIPTHVVLPPR